MADRQRSRIGPVRQPDRLGDHLGGVLHRPDRAHDAVQLHHQPPEQHREPQRETEREGDRAGGNITGEPELHRKRCNRGDHHPGKQVESRPHPGDQSGKLLDLRDQPQKTLADIGVIALIAAEQFQRQDVGKRIDKPARHHRVDLGQFLRVVTNARHEIAGKQCKDRDPECNQRGQPPVERGHQRHGRDRVDRHEPDHLQERRHQIADRLAGGRDLGDDPAGEIILEEGQRLARHIAVGLPAHHVLEARSDRLLLDQHRSRQQRHAHNDHRERHADQRPAMSRHQTRPAGLARGFVENVDQHAHEPERRRLHQRRAAAKHQHGEERPFRLPQIEPDETEQRGRRLFHRPVGKRIDPVFEDAGDATEDHDAAIHGFGAARKRAFIKHVWLSACMTVFFQATGVEAHKKPGPPFSGPGSSYSAAVSAMRSSSPPRKPPDWRRHRSA